jgi:hypothetical protein
MNGECKNVKIAMYELNILQTSNVKRNTIIYDKIYFRISKQVSLSDYLAHANYGIKLR